MTNLKNQTTEQLALQNISNLTKSSTTIEVRYNLISIYGAILKSTDIFKHNIDIKPFVDSLPLKIEIKDYLLKARPQIIARLISELYRADDTALLIFIKKAEELLKNFKDNSEESSTEINENESKSNKNAQTKKRTGKANYIDQLLDKYSRGNYK
ncbi:hypothetical protein [Lacticaseibacillus pantheris]|uniref:hypothetical protein n=1 Tax=Lacticaseibacillus pantheris TaxID=171523 RepID=UPI00070550CA|nr:hypothetical protein [Lacticaseibacillus pantheris]